MSRVVSGYFDYRPYQLIIAASVLAFIYSSFILVYYILPVDADSKKVLPGASRLLLSLLFKFNSIVPQLFRNLILLIILFLSYLFCFPHRLCEPS